MFRFEGLDTACRGGDAALDGDESTIDQLEKNAKKGHLMTHYTDLGDTQAITSANNVPCAQFS